MSNNIIEFLNAVGKADPYFVIHNADDEFPGEDYSGKDIADAQFCHKSEVVYNDLNPKWDPFFLQLNKYSSLNCYLAKHTRFWSRFNIWIFFGRIFQDGRPDPQKKILIDIWDDDGVWRAFGKSDDFMSYCVLSLQELMDAAREKTPITLRPPPKPHAQEVGLLYVEDAIIVDVQVKIQAIPEIILSQVPTCNLANLHADSRMTKCCRKKMTTAQRSRTRWVIFSRRTKFWDFPGFQDWSVSVVTAHLCSKSSDCTETACADAH